MAFDLFDCSSCTSQEIMDVSTAPQECLICQKTDCNDCINDEGVCVPCQ